MADAAPANKAAAPASKKESGGSYYAWSPIKAGKGEEKVRIKPGDSVSAGDLGVSDEEFQSLIEAGSVRKQKYPDMPEGYQDSPVNRMRELAAEAEEGEEPDPSLANAPQSAPYRSDASIGSAPVSPPPPSSE